MADIPPLPQIPSDEGAKLLSEALVSSLDILFSRNPLTYTEEDMQRIVLELRAQRARWDTAEKEGKTRAPKAPKAPKPILDLSEVEL